MPVPAPGYELVQFFDLSLDLFCVVGFDGYYKLVNGSFERVLGYPREELLARPIMEFVHPDDIDRANEVLGVLGTGHDVVGFESRLICADGSVRRFEWNTRAMPHLGVVYGIARDVTERSMLAEEQAALRRVATLVARQSPRDEVFGAVAEETGRMLGATSTTLWRYEGDGTATLEGRWGVLHDRTLVGSRFPLDGNNIAANVSRSGHIERMDDYDAASGAIGLAFKSLGVRAGVGVPVVVEGRLWGAMGAAAREPLAPDAESRIAAFTELVVTTIANSEARKAVTRLLDEQAALRRVATQVAEDPESTELFSAVAREVAAVLDVQGVIVERFEADGSQVILGSAYNRKLERAEASFGVGVKMPFRPGTLAAAVVETRRAARLEDYSAVGGEMGAVARIAGIGSGCAAPIIVDGRLWGQMCVYSSRGTVLPAGIEHQLDDFVKLVVTAISSYDARASLRLLADEQAALRRVATLVALGTPADELFAAVCVEVESLAGADASAVVRFESDETVTVMGDHAALHAVGARVQLDPAYIVAEVRRTGEAARFDTDDPEAPEMPELVRAERIHSALASPIVVEGRLWGAITTFSRGRALAAGMERRLADFTELVATAISNLHARAELAASRARIAAAADEERRRVVRDLHDGAQQRLVHTVVTLNLAQRALEQGADEGTQFVGEAIEQAERAIAEVRELAHGILPSVLTHGGLRAAIDALAARTPVPVEIDVPSGRLPAPVEATAYFVAAEALTNMAKHASAEQAAVVARTRRGMLHVEVRDDGVGGASEHGTGLVGLADRLAVLDGRLEVHSPPGGGTRISAAIPLPRSGDSDGA